MKYLPQNRASRGTISREKTSSHHSLEYKIYSFVLSTQQVIATMLLYIECVCPRRTRLSFLEWRRSAYAHAVLHSPFYSCARCLVPLLIITASCPSSNHSILAAAPCPTSNYSILTATSCPFFQSILAAARPIVLSNLAAASATNLLKKR